LGRVEGITRPVFIRNGRDYSLTDLQIYADGSIWCWEWVDLAGLKAKVASGWVATSFEVGARASAHHLGSWRFAEPQSGMKPEWLLGEVADEIDKLNGRPDSTGRCLHALDQYLVSRTEEDRAALRAAYEAIPEHLRRYALGDMDSKDWPLRVLCAGPGGQVETYYQPGHEPVTEDMHQRALDYFANRQRDRDKWAQRTYPDGPEGADSPTLHLNQPSGQTGRPSGSRSWHGCCGPSSPSTRSLPRPCWPPATDGSSTPASARATGTPGADRDVTGWGGCLS
jgi:hypothetical protein